MLPELECIEKFLLSAYELLDYCDNEINTTANPIEKLELIEKREFVNERISLIKEECLSLGGTLPVWQPKERKRETTPPQTINNIITEVAIVDSTITNYGNFQAGKESVINQTSHNHQVREAETT
jgi:hypothetical protein